MNETITKATVIVGSSAILLARIIGLDGTPITSDDIDTIDVDVYSLDPKEQIGDTLHPDKTTAITDLTTGPVWIVDPTGYDFSYLMSGDSWPITGVYSVVATFYPTDGDQYAFKHIWQVTAETDNAVTGS